MASAPYLIGSNGAASTSSLIITVTQSTSNGDTLQVGVTLNTTPAIPRVTDSQGNVYSLILSSITETGAQLYVFEAANAAALSSVTPDTITVTVTQT